MDGPTGPLTPWEATETQAKKTTTINGMLEAASPAMLYGYNAAASAALTWAYFGGNLLVSGAIVAIADGTVTLTASATNYIEADPTTGAVSVNQTGFDSGKTPLYKVTSGTTGPTAWQDWRQGGGGGTGGSGATVTTATFTVAAVGSAESVDVVNGAAFPNGSYVVISDGTHALIGEVTAGGTTNSLTVETAQIVTGSSGATMAPAATVSFSGPQGPAGSNGTNGTNGHGATTTTAAFTMAAAGSTQSVAVSDPAAFPTNAICLITDGTHALIGLITAGGSSPLAVETQQITAGGAGNTMGTSATVTFAGAQGAAGSGSGATTTTATFTVEAAGSTQSVDLANPAAFPVGTYCVISDGTNAFVGHVTGLSGSTATVQTDLISNGAAGDTMANGATVTFSGKPGGNSSGSISISAAVSPSTINLTTEGTFDWFALTSVTIPRAAPQPQKLLGVGIANGFDWVPGGMSSFSQTSFLSVSASPSDDLQGVGLSAHAVDYGYYTTGSGTGFGFRLVVPANSQSRILRIYGSYYSADITFAAQLSDGSAAPISTTVTGTSGTAGTFCTAITFESQHDGAQLIVTALVSANHGSNPNIKFDCASMQ